MSEEESQEGSSEEDEESEDEEESEYDEEDEEEDEEIDQQVAQINSKASSLKNSKLQATGNQGHHYSNKSMLTNQKKSSKNNEDIRAKSGSSKQYKSEQVAAHRRPKGFVEETKDDNFEDQQSAVFIPQDSDDIAFPQKQAHTPANAEPSALIDLDQDNDKDTEMNENSGDFDAPFDEEGADVRTETEYRVTRREDRQDTKRENVHAFIVDLVKKK